MGRVQGGARAAFAKVCKMSVAGGCSQTHMTECSHGRVSVKSIKGECCGCTCANIAEP